MKNNFMFLFIISLHIYLINAENIFILESAVEKPSSNKNILSFEIKAGIIESIESNIEFQIESEFYENDKYIKDKNIDCNNIRSVIWYPNYHKMFDRFIRSRLFKGE